MKISVIIPTYKPQAYLWECLDSVVAQTFPKEDFELILVLNGCTEPYKSDIERYISAKMEGMHVQFLHTERGGVSNARNMGLDVAKGEYIAFIDDDDYVSPAYLAELYQVASPDTISLCYPYAFDDGRSDVQRKYSVTDAYEYCMLHGCGSLSCKVRKFFSGPWMKLIPMSFIQERRYDVRFTNGEDSLFMFLISDRIKHISITSKNCIYYRRYRKNSAYTRHHSWSYILINGFHMAWAYTKIYFSRPFTYSFSLYAIRILGVIKTIIKKQ